MMLKKLELMDANTLHTWLLNPNLLYVRYRSNSFEEYMEMTQNLIQKEETGEALIRVILNEENKPIGQIALYDIHNQTGFLSTWMAAEYQGRGLNQQVKELFLSELFFEKNIEIVYAKIRRANERSLNASKKLPYMRNVTRSNPSLYQLVNHEEEIYDVFEIHKGHFEDYIETKKAQ